MHKTTDNLGFLFSDFLLYMDNYFCKIKEAVSAASFLALSLRKDHNR